VISKIPGNSAGIVLAVIFAIAVFIAFSLWSHKIGSNVVREWARARNLRVVRLRRQTFVKVWRPASSPGYQYFRVTFLDKDGLRHTAAMRLEADCTEPEMVDVIWEENKPLI
jgi:hypothetical protein